MIRLWELLWHGCWHNWQFNTVQKVFDKTSDTRPVGNNIIYQCSKCNRVKSVSV